MTLVAIALEDRRQIPQGRDSERAVADAMERTVESIERVCAATGWPTKRIVVGGSQGTGLSWARGLLEDLERIQPDVVLNLVEGVGGDARLQAAVAWLLEMSGIPYTGSPPAALSLALDKPVAKSILAANGIAVAAGRLADRGDETFPELVPPFIVKPSRESGSRGLSLDSVRDDEAQVLRQVLHVSRVFRQRALVEEFASGREFHAVVLGAGEACELLPLLEIDYSGLPAGKPRLLTFDARWKEDSPECIGATHVAAAEIEPALHADLAAWALHAYRTLGFRDYGRIVLRVHPQRGLVLLDANANPDMGPRSAVARAAVRVGLKYADLIERLVEGALLRGRPVS